MEAFHNEYWQYRSCLLPEATYFIFSKMSNESGVDFIYNLAPQDKNQSCHAYKRKCGISSTRTEWPDTSMISTYVRLFRRMTHAWCFVLLGNIWTSVLAAKVLFRYLEAQKKESIPYHKQNFRNVTTGLAGPIFLRSSASIFNPR